MKINSPFEITKAVDFSDEEIKKYWVDLTARKKFHDVLKPTSPVPMIILGAKGSGKTHLMRYHSFQLQKLRHRGNLVNGIVDDGYIGIYVLCSGLNPERFSGKNISDEVWKSYFSYYFELWLTEISLSVLNDIKSASNEIILNENKVCEKIAELFDSINEEVELTFSGLINYIITLRKKVDIAINNAAIPGRFGAIPIKATAGKLIFGLPKIIVNATPKFKKIKFVYLVDEFENINVSQQMHINTLIREKEIPTTFKVGVRLYGMKTYMTYSGGEENKEGSEYEKLVLDKYLRDHKYGAFFEAMCNRRILFTEDMLNLKRSTINIDEYFEVADIENLSKKIQNKYLDKERPYFSKLVKKLNNSKIDEIEAIVKCLSYEEDPLLERTNVFLFYREWKKNSCNLKLSAVKISKDLKKYLSNPKDNTAHKRVLDKYKNDIIAQLLNECGEDIIYSGFNELVVISHGIARVLIILLKNITKWSTFRGEMPFHPDSKISIKSQINGLKETAEWFWEDARYPGEEGENVKKCVLRIAHFLREIRYSDLPPECSLTAFTFDESQLDSVAKYYIDLAEKLSYIIKVGERKAKNSKKILTTYQINRILAPKWELPIYKRGDLSLSMIEVNTIFSKANEEDFSRLIKKRIQKYNAPFIQSQYNDGLGLFDEIEY